MELLSNGGLWSNCYFGYSVGGLIGGQRAGLPWGCSACTSGSYSYIPGGNLYSPACSYTAISGRGCVTCSGSLIPSGCSQYVYGGPNYCLGQVSQYNCSPTSTTTSSSCTRSHTDCVTHQASVSHYCCVTQQSSPPTTRSCPLGIISFTNTNTNTNTDHVTDDNCNTCTNHVTHICVTNNVDVNTNTTHVNGWVSSTSTVNLNFYCINQSVAVSPIVLDLSGTGKLDASGGNWKPHQGMKGNHVAMFDIRGDGMDMMMEWVGPQSGLLVLPKADGTVDGSCLFGTCGGYLDGFQKLAVLDKNHDGKLMGDELKGLMVWVNAAGDGKVHDGELKSLDSLGITELDVHQQDMRATFVMNGQKQVMWDWWPTALDVRKEKLALTKQ